MSAILPHRDPPARQPTAGGEAAGMPPVRTILAAMVWLSARHRASPEPKTAHALARQARRLALHPQATAEDLAAGLRLAGAACQDIPGWMSLCAAAEHGLRH